MVCRTVVFIDKRLIEDAWLIVRVEEPARRESVPGVDAESFKPDGTEYSTYGHPATVVDVIGLEKYIPNARALVGLETFCHLAQMRPHNAA
jgi:hypothetical protein